MEKKSIITLQFAVLLFPVAIIVVVGCYERCTIISSAYIRYLLCINNVSDNVKFNVVNATPYILPTINTFLWSKYGPKRTMWESEWAREIGKEKSEKIFTNINIIRMKISTFKQKYF